MNMQNVRTLSGASIKRVLKLEDLYDHTRHECHFINETGIDVEFLTNREQWENDVISGVWRILRQSTRKGVIKRYVRNRARRIVRSVEVRFVNPGFQYSRALEVSIVFKTGEKQQHTFYME